MTGKKLFFRKLQQQGNPPYFQIHYDFLTKHPKRGKFYKEAPIILGGRVRDNALTQSVVGVFNEDTARKIFDLARDCGAESVVMCYVKTLRQFPEPKRKKRNS